MGAVEIHCVYAKEFRDASEDLWGWIYGVFHFLNLLVINGSLFEIRERERESVSTLILWLTIVYSFEGGDGYLEVYRLLGVG